jgi:hemolysin III
MASLRRRLFPPRSKDADGESAALDDVKPLLRGVLHQGAWSVSLVVGVLLIVGADTPREIVSAAIFSSSVALCFGTSAVYHRVNWSPRPHLLMRRADHAAIYLLIGGTYTPVCLLTLHGAWRPTVLAVVWTGAAAAIVLELLWVTAPKWTAAAIPVALGWISVVVLPQLVARLNAAAITLLLVGGLVYTAGAVVYARRKPNPAPGIFGYHEVFHALTIVAVACQYVAIAFFVVRVP